MNEQTAATNSGSQTEAVALWVNPRRFDPFVRRFYRLAAVWKTETGHLSNLTERCDHAAYRSIVEMGPEVIPLILAELENEPDYWFAALRELTGENPVPRGAGDTQANGKQLARLGRKTWLYPDTQRFLNWKERRMGMWFVFSDAPQQPPKQSCRAGSTNPADNSLAGANRVHAAVRQRVAVLP